jgi:hypothetical protein
VRERLIVRCPFMTFSPFKSRDKIYFRGRAITTHVSNPQDYDNHVETLTV